MIEAYAAWSPLQLAHAVGLRIDLRTERGSVRTAYIVSAAGKSRPVSHSRACDVLSRLAKRRGVDPSTPPLIYPRALADGAEQTPSHFGS